MNFKKNKKAEIASEYPVMIVSLIIIGLVLFFIGTMISTVKTKYETSNLILNYEYPLIFTNTFLNFPLEKIDQKKFKEFNNINYVKDLFYLNSIYSKKLIEKYKKNYINNLTYISENSQFNSISLFEYFSNYNKPTPLANDLLFFKYDIKFTELKLSSNIFNSKNNEIINTENLYFIIKTKDNTYSKIYFKLEGLN